MAEQQKRLNTFISADTFKRVKLYAAANDMTLGAAVENLVRRSLVRDPAADFLAKTEAAAQKLNSIATDLAQHEPEIARRSGLSPENKRLVTDDFTRAFIKANPTWNPRRA